MLSYLDTLVKNTTAAVDTDSNHDEFWINKLSGTAHFVPIHPKNARAVNRSGQIFQLNWYFSEEVISKL